MQLSRPEPSMYLRGRTARGLLITSSSKKLHVPRAVTTQRTMVQAIEGPKEVTELLTDLSNKYEAVRGWGEGGHDLQLLLLAVVCTWCFACLAIQHKKIKLSSTHISVLCRFTRRLRLVTLPPVAPTCSVACMHLKQTAWDPAVYC